MLSRIVKRSLVLSALATALLVTPALAAPAIDGEFDVPGIGTNNKIVQGPDGNMWVTLSEAAGKEVAKVTPEGAVTSYDLKIVTPSGIAVGPEGRIWVTSNGAVTSFNPADPEGTKKTTAVAEIGTSHSIVKGPDGNMWVATEGKVLRIQASDPTKVEPFAVAGLSPKDIDVAGSLLAVADSGGEPRIVTLTTGGEVATYPIPGGSQGVAGTPGGLIAFSQQGNAPEQVGLISPPTAQPLIETPGGIGDPFGVALGSDEAFWFAMSGNDGVARLTPGGSLTLLNGFEKGSFPRQVAAGPGNTIWVTLDMVDKVGRISGLEPPVVAPPPPPPPPLPGARPRTILKSGPKGRLKTHARRRRVRFAFRSPDAGATFECRLVKVTKKKKKRAQASKAARFRSCRSPKSYRLRPARYRFEVRAVLGDAVDATPARRSFRIVRVRPR